MQETNIGWTDFSRPVDQLLDQSRMRIMRQRIKKVLDISILFAAIAVSASGNQIQADGRAALSDRDDMIYCIRGALAVGALAIPQLEDNGTNIWINCGYSASSRLGLAFDLSSVFIVFSVASSLVSGITGLTSSVSQITFGHPRLATIAPLFALNLMKFTFRQRRSRRSQFREATRSAGRFQSVSAGAINSKVFYREPRHTYATSLQPGLSALNVILRGKSDSGGGIFDCSEV